MDNNIPWVSSARKWVSTVYFVQLQAVNNGSDNGNCLMKCSTSASHIIYSYSTEWSKTNSPNKIASGHLRISLFYPSSDI